jgi:biofilm PGA synthesis N-glycosyltransferase PgaC
MKVSIVIPVRNGEATLAMCLESLLSQQTTHDFNVVVVDNASSDDTWKVARSWSDRLDLVTVQEQRIGRGSARRKGFQQVTTDVVLSTDADTLVPPDWIETLVNALMQRSAVAAVTTSCYIGDGSRMANLSMRIGMPIALRLYRILRGHYLLTGSTFAIRRCSYELAGGFDPEVDFLEDVELASRVAKVGTIRYISRPRVLTMNNVFRSGFIKGFLHYLIPYLKHFYLRGK